MKKALGIGILIVAVIVVVAVLMSRRPYTAKTELIDDKITIITDNASSMYLVKAKTGYFAIDMGNDAEAIRQGLAKSNINPSEVKTVFLTHTDRDHIGRYPLFEGAKIYLSQNEKQMIDGTAPTSRFKYLPFLKNSLPTDQYHLLADNEIVEVGGVQVKAIYLPGHTPGSTGYLVEGKYLFVGDALNLENGQVTTFIEFFTMDMAQMKVSIKKIAGYEGIKYLFTAHSGYTADYGTAMADWKN